MPQAVIMEFNMRHFREVVWKMAKKSEYLKTRTLRLKEDLSPEDQEQCQEAMIAYLVGAQVSVNDLLFFYQYATAAKGFICTLEDCVHYKVKSFFFQGEI